MLDLQSNDHPGLIDPTTISGPIPPAFPLSANNLDTVIEYRHNAGGQNSVVARERLPRGSHICYIDTYIPAPISTWSSIQTSKTTHIEVPSGIVYINHSCVPSIDIEVYSPNSDGTYASGICGELRVVADRDLEAGDELTFFYPSTEYISPRPFNCLCGAENGVCIGRQEGAHFLDNSILGKYFLNEHIKNLIAERDSGSRV
ncbi:hypothetical protein TWF225_006902 [Orbilia oligospora]|nr:hypothetical protein TWF225_006902 [Orbilia oligospora]KAF3246225.1 hypothetical protein TWF128_009033 [Orbilia oligospora]KAF3264106.1 hypothetical protein TWF217_003263 [Orbilia oligospora]